MYRCIECGAEITPWKAHECEKPACEKPADGCNHRQARGTWETVQVDDTIPARQMQGALERAGRRMESYVGA